MMYFRYYSVTICFYKMSFKKILIFNSLLFFVFGLKAQTGGEEVYLFLNLSTSARQVALGGEVLTLIDDVNQPIWNPATINESLNGKLSVNYTNFLADINIGSVSYASKLFKKLGTFHGSIKYRDNGSFIGANESGIETGNFNAKDIAISVGYSVKIPKTHIHFGSNVKIINTNVDTFSSVGIAADFGLLYNNPESALVLTFVARNIGTQISTFNGLREDLPFNLALGGSYELQHVPLKWYFTINNIQRWDISAPNPSDQVTNLNGDVSQPEISFINNALRHFTIGGELFSKRAINLRLGYNFRRAAELKRQNLRTSSGISLGFGIKFRKMKFNYAFSNYHSASNSSTFSLLINLGDKVDNDIKDN